MDGNSATISVVLGPTSITWAEPGEGVGSIGEADLDSFDTPPSLNNALNVVERTIVAWLTKLGYTPKFG